MTLIIKDGCHGRQLAKDLGLKETTVYGILKRLKKDKYVTAYWDVEGVEKPKFEKASLATLPSYLQAFDEDEQDEAKGRGAPRLLYRITVEGIKFTNKLQKTFGKPRKP
jgi:DNA-binding PadR family transcriptional regulator